MSPVFPVVGKEYPDCCTARNNPSGSALPLINTVPNGVVMDESEPSATEGSAMSPLDTNFEQFLVDDDFEFLNLWAESVQQPK